MYKDGKHSSLFKEQPSVTGQKRETKSVRAFRDKHTPTIRAERQNLGGNLTGLLSPPQSNLDMFAKG